MRFLLGKMAFYTAPDWGRRLCYCVPPLVRKLLARLLANLGAISMALRCMVRSVLLMPAA